ncbi:MAG: hypothetical protein MUO76_12390 [Anaerolineaceae bacterium]|nr:hypothetical protein [Anaerolineaceae bacterium]
MLKSFMGTAQHYFGKWEKIFKGVSDVRDQSLITYSMTGLLFTGILMYVFRLGARREINHKLRGSGVSEKKFEALFGTEKIPHGDTLNYGFKRVNSEEMQAIVCRLVKILIRKKVLYPWRLFGVHYLITFDGTGMVTYAERHCKYCLTQKLNNGTTRYYHPVLEAKLVTASGFAISLVTEFIENEDIYPEKQDCELKAFYRLTKKLKEYFPRLPMCLLLDGLFAGGPTFSTCEKYNWKYLITLKDASLSSVNDEFENLMSMSPENHKKVVSGGPRQISQAYRWMEGIDYVDSQDNEHLLNVLECVETYRETPGEPLVSKKYKWLTNFLPTSRNVNTLANNAGRLRWKIENEGFNVQKNDGFNLEHPYSQDENARKVFYYLLQIAYLIFQLMEKGSLFRKAFPNGVGSLKNIADCLLEAWRNLRLDDQEFISLYSGTFQIRFDSS